MRSDRGSRTTVGDRRAGPMTRPDLESCSVPWEGTSGISCGTIRRDAPRPSGQARGRSRVATCGRESPGGRNQSRTIPARWVRGPAQTAVGDFGGFSGGSGAVEENRQDGARKSPEVGVGSTDRRAEPRRASFARGNEGAGTGTLGRSQGAEARQAPRVGEGDGASCRSDRDSGAPAWRPEQQQAPSQPMPQAQFFEDLVVWR